MFCPNCGTEISPTEKVCPSCGAPLPDKTVKEATTATKGEEAVTKDTAKTVEAPAPKPQESKKVSLGEGAHIFRVAVAIIALVVGLAKFVGASNTQSSSTSTAITSHSTGGSNNTSSSGGADTGHSIDTSTSADWLSDPDLTDAYGNITLYAFMELDGKQLVTLCNKQNYEVNIRGGDLYFVNNKRNSILSVADSNGTLLYNSVLDLAKGGKGKACGYLCILNAHSSESATYLSISHCDTECSATANGEYVAICRDSSDRRYLATVDALEDGSHRVVLYNPEGIEAGLFDEIHGGEYGKDAESVFTAFTGKPTDTYE